MTADEVAVGVEGFLGVPDYETLRPLDKAKLDRKAVPAALEKLQYLTVTRRRATPPIRRKITR